jgi:lipopolysaccharide biosynthesis glycosyltransferase
MDHPRMNTAVVLITDKNFVVPTIGAALSARSNISDKSIPIFIYITNSKNEQLDKLNKIVQPEGISISSASIPDLAKISAAEFNKTHVPVTAMARLWIDDLLDSKYERFLYLDGDLDITGSLDPLLRLPIPPGGFLAAPDLPMLIANDYGKSARLTRNYLKELGITNSSAYFNDGVLLVDRGGWKKIAAEAWAYFKRYPNRCRYHEQSALNAVAGKRRGQLSLLWNYQSDFMAIADPRKWNIEPAIWHFTGYPKPWQAKAFPWSEPFGRSFNLGSELLSHTEWAASQFDWNSVVAAANQRERLRQRLNWVYPWRRALRAKKIKSALSNSTNDRPRVDLDSSRCPPFIDLLKSRQ